MFATSLFILVHIALYMYKISWYKISLFIIIELKLKRDKVHVDRIYHECWLLFQSLDTFVIDMRSY